MTAHKGAFPPRRPTGLRREPLYNLREASESLGISYRSLLGQLGGHTRTAGAPQAVAGFTSEGASGSRAKLYRLSELRTYLKEKGVLP